MPNKKRTAKGRPANEPPKYPKTPHDCDHTDSPWNIGGEIHNMRSDLPGESEKPAAERELLGHCLQIANVRCLGCGQVFRFTNVPTLGNWVVNRWGRGMELDRAATDSECLRAVMTSAGSATDAMNKALVLLDEIERRAR